MNDSGNKAGIAATADRLAGHMGGQFVPHTEPHVAPGEDGAREVEWPAGTHGHALGFDGGTLMLFRDGSGALSFDDRELDWDQPDDNPADYRVCKLPASEVIAIRDQINKLFPPLATSPHAAGDRLQKAAQALLNRSADFMSGALRVSGTAEWRELRAALHSAGGEAETGKT